MKCSVIILNWNGRALLADCLNALLPQCDASIEVLVVDNGSHDGSAAWLYQHYPHVRLLVLPKNRGFSGGVNVGLHVARGDVLLLLNNDAIVEPNFIAAILAPFEQQPTLATSAGVLTFAHQPTIIASAGIQLYRDGVATDAGLLYPLDQLAQQPYPIWGGSGGAVAYRRAALADVGIFDEGYFAYLEDVDLAWRLQLREWQTVLAPQAVARHIYSATGGEGSPFKDWLIARNRWRAILRCWPTPLLARDLPLMLAYDGLACAQALVRRRWTTISGRLHAFRQLPQLRQQRQAIQARRTATSDELDRWIQPARSPLAIWRENQALARLIKQR
ncbi:glycosyltransferase family 2 protein [Herpetosiphon sp. NSE202]|uniref:glycosyltransferase family 2 protein n=1 Tax=Herpetosiphon sp. NSE202 TaxID=3351349 RepID=UPI003636B5A6